MALKRKRSTVSFTPLADSSNPFAANQWNDNAPRMPFFFTQSKPIEPMRPENSWAWKENTETEPKHLNSRTHKRYRDNRPDESIVHGRFRRPGKRVILTDTPPQRLPSASYSMRRNNIRMPLLSLPRPRSQLLERTNNRKSQPCIPSGTSLQYRQTPYPAQRNRKCRQTYVVKTAIDPYSPKMPWNSTRAYWPTTRLAARAAGMSAVFVRFREMSGGVCPVCEAVRRALQVSFPFTFRAFERCILFSFQFALRGQESTQKESLNACRDREGEG